MLEFTAASIVGVGRPTLPLVSDLGLQNDSLAWKNLLALGADGSLRLYVGTSLEFDVQLPEGRLEDLYSRLLEHANPQAAGGIAPRSNLNTESVKDGFQVTTNLLCSCSLNTSQAPLAVLSKILPKWKRSKTFDPGGFSCSQKAVPYTWCKP